MHFIESDIYFFQKLKNKKKWRGFLFGIKKV